MCQYGELRKHCRWTAGSQTSINSIAVNPSVPGINYNNNNRKLKKSGSRSSISSAPCVSLYNCDTKSKKMTFPQVLPPIGVLKKHVPQLPPIGVLKKHPQVNDKKVKKTLRISPYRRSIVRMPGWMPEEEPDMVSLGLPFNVCRSIFIYLSLTDLGSCMSVCKEWRSYIDTCDFWRYFLQRTYDLNLQTPPKWSVLREWRHRSSCLKVSVTPSTDRNPEKPDSYVFRPFPEMWRCGVIVAYGQEPPAGNIEQLHGFLRALQWLSRLGNKIEELGLRRELNIEPCLLPWTKERMPTPREVLDGFNAHIEIIRSACDARTLTAQELRSYYGLLRSRYRGPKFSDKLYYWFTDNASRTNLIFDCDPDVIDPTPSFILTRLAPGWVGGAMYAV